MLYIIVPFHSTITCQCFQASGDIPLVISVPGPFLHIIFGSLAWVPFLPISSPEGQCHSFLWFWGQAHRELVIYLLNKKKSSFQKHTVQGSWAIPAKSYFCIWWALLRICIFSKENWQTLSLLHVIISHPINASLLSSLKPWNVKSYVMPIGAQP